MLVNSVYAICSSRICCRRGFPQRKMTQPARNVAVLGSTGSIGTSALEVIAASQGQLRAVALAACTSTESLLHQAQRIRPRWVLVSDEAASAQQDWSGLAAETQLLVGPEAIRTIASAPEVDIVLA